MPLIPVEKKILDELIESQLTAIKRKINKLIGRWNYNLVDKFLLDIKNGTLNLPKRELIVFKRLNCQFKKYLRLKVESSNKGNSNIKGLSKIKGVLQEFKQILAKLYGPKLHDIIVYGSFARGEEREDSDLDIAIILKGEIKPAEELVRIIDVTYDLELKYNLFFSFRPISLDRYRSENTSLLINIKEEGISI